MDRLEFIKAKRIVVKLGTNVLRNDEGYVSLPRVYSFIEDIANLVKSGKEVIVITSGAVGLGKKRLGLEDTQGTALKQACAAIGQGKLMSIYENGFDTYGLTAAQILLTEDDFSVRERYLSLRTTLNKLLELGAIPVINQNDTVSTLDVALRYVKEDMQVCFSDNDKLSALVASDLCGFIVILSDINGLYNDNPKTNPDAELIKSVKEVDDKILALASGVSDGGRGGMETKLKAARLVTRFGGKVLIANGKQPFIIKRIFEGEDLGTMFLPSNENLSDKKRWIGYATNIIGKIIVNKGAKEALLAEKSLLPIGVVEVKNTFKKGDVISILDEENNEIARGIVNYDSDSCKKVIGCHSDNIAEILGFKNYDAIITRDNITIL